MEPKIILPGGYREALHIDLQKDRKLALLINGICLGLAVPLFLLGCSVASFYDFLFDGNPFYLMVAVAGSIVYIFLHELVHGIFMRGFSGVRPHYGFTGLYAYAGSNVYFDRTRYIIIAMAPIVVWGIVLAVICALVPQRWFWSFYLIQIMNITGAAGDLYVTWRFMKLPRDILIQDTGIAMTVYTRQQEP